MLGVDAGEADGDEDGHGEQEGDVARREEGGDLKEGEGDKEEEDHDEEDKDTAEEDDDKSEDEEEEGPSKAAWDAAARDAAEDGERDRECDRDLEWGRRRTTPVSAACTRGAAPAHLARASVTRSTLCLNLTASALTRSKSSDSFRTSLRQSPDGCHATFQTEEGAAGSGKVEETSAEALVAAAAAAAADGDNDVGGGDDDGGGDEDIVGVDADVAAESPPPLPANTVGIVGNHEIFFVASARFAKLIKLKKTEGGKPGEELNFV